MNRILVISIALAAVLSVSSSALGGSYNFSYQVRPGQSWMATQSSQTETTFMGNKTVTRTKTIIEYEVSKGPKKGWVSLEAGIKGHSSASGSSGQMDLSKMRFTADMHRSGDIRNIKHSGSPLPPMDTGGGEMSPEMAAMYEQSAKMMADAWKNAVFWFPELPEDALEPGDEFDVVRKMGMGSSTAGMQMESVSKQIFSLEDVSQGLAYFSVKERSLTKTGGTMGSKTETKTAGKGEAIFDLEQGMWIELTEKSRIRMQLGNMAGMGGGIPDALSINKYTMERR